MRGWLQHVVRPLLSHISTIPGIQSMLNSNSLDATPLFPYTGQDPLADIYDRDTAQCLQK